jgi:chitinase
VCCSKYGFCGTTKEFCGDKKVDRPSCAVNGQGFDRVVGYYESWSQDRPCNKFYPEQIPKGIYTHLNFAFATIDPVSFEVKLAAPTDSDLVRRLTDLKIGDPGLKVYVAIGGWAFNDPGPTATTFSDIAGSETNTNKFTQSLIRFMSTYNFDGVDIDWEYPEADDRSGRGADYANLPLFLQRVRAALRASGGRDGLSITLPLSFWYLRHFDIIKMQDTVDFYNIMSYDVHGTWDQNNKWVGPSLNSHTNLTEIKDMLDLLWRNGIKSNKVTLGTAFYGRSFTVTNPACTAPGCTYGSGGTKQACSHEVGVVLNSEIVDIQKRTGAQGVLLAEAAVKQLVYDGNQWVTYDDEDTLKMRADFARSQCLGGVMVWAVSHDTPDARFNKALAVAANRKYQALAAQSDGTETLVTEHPQCKWTNCLESE